MGAFSGDAIPVHLLTREALELYLRHLKPSGILAIHTSNSFLVLDRAVKQLADQMSYPAKLVENEGNDYLSIAHSDWVLISRNSHFLNSPVVTRRERPITIPPGLQPWTDDHNNLFQILRPEPPPRKNANETLIESNANKGGDARCPNKGRVYAP